ncbi:MAG: InlB B-repeat-containing protein, partial [Lachnospiraceae bacterium]|nr:InlB B-repeat-containing protein [Lachnospiraceae bacterium]
MECSGGSTINDYYGTGVSEYDKKCAYCGNRINPNGSHYYYVPQLASDSCYEYGAVHSGCFSVEEVECCSATIKDSYYTCDTCGEELYAYIHQCSDNTYYYDVYMNQKVNIGGNYYPDEEVGPLFYEKRNSDMPAVNACFYHRIRTLRCPNVEFGSQICDKVVTDLLAINTKQVLKAGETMDTSAYAKFLNGTIQTVTCDIYSGFSATKYNEWQTVTLSYGTYSAVDSKTPRTVTIQVYLERTETDLTLNVEPAGAGTVTGAGSYQVSSEVTVGTTGNPGYTFDGWYNGTEKKSGDASYTFEMPGENTTLTANYTAKTYTVTAVSESTDMGTVTAPSLAKYMDFVTLQATPQAGYTFVGWYDGVRLVSSNASYTFTMPCYNVSYTARFSPPTYTVSFDANGGSACAGIQVQYLGTYGALPIPTRNGYVFQGWKYNGSFMTPLTTVSVKADHTLTAEWEVAGPDFILIHYGEKYGKNSWSMDAVNVGQLGLTTIRLGAWLPVAVKRGYSFTGWYRTENSRGNGDSLGDVENVVDTETVMRIAGQHTLHAGWIPKSFTLSFDP